MKRFLFYALLMLPMVFTSCSESKDEPVMDEEQTTRYEDDEVYTYLRDNGDEMYIYKNMASVVFNIKDYGAIINKCKELGLRAHLGTVDGQIEDKEATEVIIPTASCLTTGISCGMENVYEGYDGLFLERSERFDEFLDLYTMFIDIDYRQLLDWKELAYVAPALRSENGFPLTSPATLEIRIPQYEEDEWFGKKDEHRQVIMELAKEYNLAYVGTACGLDYGYVFRFTKETKALCYEISDKLHGLGIHHFIYQN